MFREKVIRVTRNTFYAQKNVPLSLIIFNIIKRVLLLHAYTDLSQLLTLTGGSVSK
jgi:hypothetical protein